MKATTAVDEKKHLPDLAFQGMVLRGAGLAPKRYHLVHLNRGYRLQGEVEPLKLLQVEEVTEAVEALQGTAEFQDALRQVQETVVDALEELSTEPSYPCECWRLPAANRCEAVREAGALSLEAVAAHPELLALAGKKASLFTAALAPELSYKQLPVKNGDEAMAVWSALIREETLSPEALESVFQHLLIYCGLDTYAMGAIFMALLAKATGWQVEESWEVPQEAEALRLARRG